MSVRLTLLCHAATAASRTTAFPADEPLEARSVQRLETYPPSLGRSALCLTSPALRARQTAEALNLNAAVESNLRDCDYGRWAGLSLDAVQAEEPAAVAAWLGDPAAAPHGGESIIDLIARVGAWLDGQRDAAGPILAVTHAAVIRAAAIHIRAASPVSFWRLDVAPLAVMKASGNAGRWTLSSIAPSLPARVDRPRRPLTTSADRDPSS